MSGKSSKPSSFFSQTKYERNFEAEEEKMRFEIFKRKLAFVEEQNAKFNRGESSWSAGINIFSDRKDDEIPFTKPFAVPQAKPLPIVLQLANKDTK